MDGRKAVQLPRIDTVEPKLRKIEPTNKDVDRTNRIIPANPIFQAFRE